jgi:uncharacterized protein involved in exopolysaccharide biosynthesis
VNDEPRMNESSAADSSVAFGDDETSLIERLLPFAENIWLLLLGPIVIGAIALGIAFLITPTFTATTTLLPPQQQQSSAASALASLGSLAGLAGGAIKTPADQYVALLQSVTVSDHLIDRFKLIEVYERDFRVDARNTLARHVRISVGKKDGLMTIEVDDHSAQRAADIANRYVDELRQITSTLALTEAQQRRAFFDRQLQQTRDKLVAAQQALQSSGFNAGALKAEPKAAAETYAKLRAEATSAEVRVQALRTSLADSTSEVQQQLSVLKALRAQLARVEQAAEVAPDGPDYISRYREFKYQETLLELFARQYELARVDESREGALIQVVDPALVPERKSAPKRSMIALGAALVGFVLIAGGLLVRQSWRRAGADPARAESVRRLRTALRPRR